MTQRISNLIKTGITGFEPATFDLTNQYSNQLSYIPFLLKKNAPYEN